ncbi:DNA alkylation repair protein [Pseudolactococcus insecticola]|uniref:DNA alkylation repair protein n=1 Tax=Pseudolactococcus insecticola TaxID=2709158 RepID=A0A6A0BA35_9LACT|nr:DNA alkylation repair protein [Lactococcus insecticola]GFH41321.1 DNA alkylation repair protein [Lactococcus insecticola]
MTNDIPTIIAQFQAHKNPENALAMASYMKDNFIYLGIKTPERRKLSKDFLQEKAKQDKAVKLVDWEFIKLMWQQDYREFQYLATDYLKKVQKNLQLADLPKLYQLAVSKSWWDSVDNLDEHVGSIVRREPSAKAIMRDWSRDENFWIRRLAIDHQLGFKLETDAELLSEIIQNNFDSDEFFINKAIGWALRDYSKVAPDWVRDFIENHRSKLSKLSIREGSKYID